MSQKPTDPRAFLPGSNIEALVSDQAAADVARAKVEGDLELRDAVQAFAVEGSLPPYLPQTGAKMAAVVEPARVIPGPAAGRTPPLGSDAVSASGPISQQLPFVAPPGMVPQSAVTPQGGFAVHNGAPPQPAPMRPVTQPMASPPPPVAEVKPAPMDPAAAAVADAQSALKQSESSVVIAPEVLAPRVEPGREEVEEQVVILEEAFIQLSAAPARKTTKRAYRPPGAQAFLLGEGASRSEEAEAPPAATDAKAGKRGAAIVLIVALGMVFLAILVWIAFGGNQNGASTTAPTASGVTSTAAARSTSTAEPAHTALSAPTETAAPNPTGAESPTGSHPTEMHTATAPEPSAKASSTSTVSPRPSGAATTPTAPTTSTSAPSTSATPWKPNW